MNRNLIILIAIIVLCIFSYGTANAVPTIVAKITVGNSPTGVGINPVSNKTYVAAQNSNTVSVIDEKTNTVSSTILVGNRPLYVEVNAVTNKIYAANYNDNTVSVIDGNTNSVVSTILVGTNPVGIGVNTQTNKIYVGNYNSNSVSVIDGNTNTVVSTILVGSHPSGVSVNMATNFVYAVNSGSATVSVINGLTNSVTNTITLPGGTNPQAAAVYPTTNTIYVNDPGTNQIFVINGNTNSVTTSIAYSVPSAGGIAIDTATDMPVFGSFSTSLISVIDGVTNKIVNSFNEQGSPDYLGINSVTNIGYFSDISSNTVTVVTGLTTLISADDMDAASLSQITAPTNPVLVNTQITASATFTDDSDDTHTASWNWGDGTTTAGTVTESGGSGSVQNTHTYPAPGEYTITLMVDNSDGRTAAAQFKYLVVYNPEAGFATGGGWYVSPPGDDSLSPLATGKANFGFNVKYHGTSTAPTGDTLFSFTAGNIDLKSTGYNWLVISSSTQAQFQGTGTINGGGSYLFNISIQSGTTNFIRIQIIDTTNNNVIYDTQPGAPLTAAPTTPLGGGNFVIHQS